MYISKIIFKCQYKGGSMPYFVLMFFIGLFLFLFGSSDDFEYKREGNEKWKMMQIREFLKEQETSESKMVSLETLFEKTKFNIVSIKGEKRTEEGFITPIGLLLKSVEIHEDEGKSLRFLNYEKFENNTSSRSQDRINFCIDYLNELKEQKYLVSFNVTDQKVFPEDEKLKNDKNWIKETCKIYYTKKNNNILVIKIN